MSRLGNEDVRKTAGGILANLVESENLKVKKSVLTDLKGTVETRVLEESVEPAKEPEGANDPVPGEGKEPLKEEEPVEEITDEVIDAPAEEETPEGMTDDIAKATELIAKIFAGEVTPEEKEAARAELTDMIAGEAEPTEEVPEEEVEVDDEIVEEGCSTKKEGCNKDKKLKEEDGDKIEEKMVEGLEIVDVSNNAFLLKESAGYIVGKNYNKSTGLIEEAETYKTEKVARKAFARISK